MLLICGTHCRGEGGREGGRDEKEGEEDGRHPIGVADLWHAL